MVTPPRTKRQLKQRTAPLSVSFSQAERDAINEAADLTGDTISAFIRAAAVKSAEREIAKALKAA